MYVLCQKKRGIIFPDKPPSKQDLVEEDDLLPASHSSKFSGVKEKVCFETTLKKSEISVSNSVSQPTKGVKAASVAIPNEL